MAWCGHPYPVTRISGSTRSLKIFSIDSLRCKKCGFLAMLGTERYFGVGAVQWPAQWSIKRGSDLRPDHRRRSAPCCDARAQRKGGRLPVNLRRSDPASSLSNLGR